MQTRMYRLEALNQYGLKAVLRQYFTPESVSRASAPAGSAVGTVAPVSAGRKRAPYSRAWTPLVTLWGMVLQRLVPGQHCADVVSAFRAGAADDLDPADRHAQPLSARLKSEATAGYVQARERLSLAAIRLGRADLQASVEVARGSGAGWHGHAVRLLDGTPYRLPPRGDLAATYGQAANQHGPSYWVTVKSVASFDLDSRTLVAHAEGPGTSSEAALLGAVLRADSRRDCVYLGDIAYGHYRVVQALRAHGQHALVRLEARLARKLLRECGVTTPLPPAGWECPYMWQPEAGVASEPGLPAEGVPGRLLYQRVTPPGGGRPVDLYLFTTLTDARAYPRAELVALYARRWQVELRYRDVKTALRMDAFDVHSDALFQRELDVGLLTYNLICTLLAQAARQAGLPAERLSFTACLRLLRDALRYGVPAWVVERYPRPLDWLIERLSHGRLPVRPNKVAHEPRAVRRRPQVFPAMKGSRGDARKQLLADVQQAVTLALNS